MPHFDLFDHGVSRFIRRIDWEFPAKGACRRRCAQMGQNLCRKDRISGRNGVAIVLMLRLWDPALWGGGAGWQPPHELVGTVCLPGEFPGNRIDFRMTRGGSWAFGLPWLQLYQGDRLPEIRLRPGTAGYRPR